MNLPDDDHVMRFVPYQRLLRDGDGNAIGALPHAFELRPDEKYLSVNWMECFKGTHEQNIAASVNAFRTTINVGAKAGFAIGNVKKVIDCCGANGAHGVRIVHRPSKNTAHSAITRLPREEQALYEALANEVFTELVLNSSIP